MRFSICSNHNILEADKRKTDHRSMIWEALSRLDKLWMIKMESFSYWRLHIKKFSKSIFITQLVLLLWWRPGKSYLISFAVCSVPVLFSSACNIDICERNTLGIDESSPSLWSLSSDDVLREITYLFISLLCKLRFLLMLAFVWLMCAVVCWNCAVDCHRRRRLFDETLM